MPALSFQEEWLDKLLRGDKQQTTRPQTTRIWIGDPIVHIYNQQRRRITDKSIRVMTGEGTTAIADRVNDAQYNYPAECPPSPFRDKFEPVYYAHILGKVKITEVYDIIPSTMSGNELEVWAMRDGFKDLTDADIWFTKRYGDDWDLRTWTVIRWNGWMERYFLADESDAL